MSRIPATHTRGSLWSPGKMVSTHKRKANAAKATEMVFNSLLLEQVDALLAQQ